MKTPYPARLLRRHLSAGRVLAWPLRPLFSCAWLMAATLGCSSAGAADHGTPAASAPQTSASQAVAPHQAAASAATVLTEPLGDLKSAIRNSLLAQKRMTLVISTKPTRAAVPVPAEPETVHKPIRPVVHTRIKRPAPAFNPAISRDYIQARAAALLGHEKNAAIDDAGASNEARAGSHTEAHWSYTGATGPGAWGQLKPEFSLCANGKRQSPINIEDSFTLKGPAEPLLFNYTASNGVVINNGHSIEVDVQGSNTLSVRGSTYNLVQIHFHSPSEEQINYRNYAMVAHLVHKNADGQLAVVAVLLEPGAANPLIDKVWTYMPLDVNDQVRMPAHLLDMNELLPKDQRYYQFLGSLTTPPCTEGVLWMVLKQPVQLSSAQLQLFEQLYRNNARPVQPVNGRVVRDAQ